MQLSFIDNIPFSEQFQDRYYQPDGVEESRYVYVQGNDLITRFQSDESISILEAGFGAAINFLVTLQAWIDSHPKNAILVYHAIEAYPLSLEQLKVAHAQFPELQDIAALLHERYPKVSRGTIAIHFPEYRAELVLYLGDINHVMPKLIGLYDAVYLDGFTPKNNPEMWQASMLYTLGKRVKKGGSLATFTAATHVKIAIEKAGFTVKKIAGFGVKREMITAIKNTSSAVPLPPWFAIPRSDVSHETSLYPVIVIGAGLAGCMVHYHLRQLGIDSLLLEKGSEIAGHSSNHLRINIKPLLTDAYDPTGVFIRNGFNYSSYLYGYIQQQADIGYVKCGIEEYIRDTKLRWKKHQLLHDNPLLSSYAHKTGEGLYYPEGAMLDPRRLCRYLLHATNGQLKLHSHVIRLSYEGHWNIHLDNGCIYKASAVVIANAEAGNQLKETAFLPLRLSRGQLSYMKQNAIDDVVSHETIDNPPLYQKGVSCETTFHPLGLQRNVSCETDAQTTLHSSSVPREIKCKTSVSHETFHNASILHYPDGYGIRLKDRMILGRSLTPQDGSLEERVSDHQANIDKWNRLGKETYRLGDALMGAYIGYRSHSTDRLPLIGPVANPEIFTQQYHDVSRGKNLSTYPYCQYYSGLYLSLAHGARGGVSTAYAALLIASEIAGIALPLTKEEVTAIHPMRFTLRALRKKM